MENLNIYGLKYKISSSSNTLNLFYFICVSNVLMYLLWSRNHSIDDNLEIKSYTLPETTTTKKVPDQSSCYKTTVFNDENKKHQFKDILDDEVLVKSNGNNIFFHLTNCINDGVPEMKPRYFIVYLD